ncbi:MAG: rhamnogalacturonan acetylesterase [Bacteroidaceae bacterium]|nr:rhamnogalacturonan acetylesterase [Bacteroidaceae bacterium]
MEDVNKVVDLTLDSLEKVKTARPVAGSSRKGDNPVLFLVGNSTMRTGTKGNGDNGQWGWGFYAGQYFNENQITVENQALGGTSSRTFYRQLWPDVKKGIRPGDYVIIELGHNDNGPFDSGRCRATIRGISATDSMIVTLKDGPNRGKKETVYSYGEYMRRFVRETRALGAHPILMSLTPRKSKGKSDASGWQPVRVADNFGGWARQIAEEMNVPFIDLNELSATKYDKMSSWKINYHFYLDNIHTSAFGAQLNARLAAEGLMASTHPELKPLQAMMQNILPPTQDVKREEGKPVLFICGDSTVKNNDNDSTGMWGWGSQASRVFDASRITLVNCAMAGRSTRTYLKEKRWEKVYNALRPGDFVTIQFGHNDIGELGRGKHRGVIACSQDSSVVSRVVTDKEAYNEVVYSFGFYLRKMIDDCREKGAVPILVSLTPRNEWPDGKIERRNDSYGRWYRDVVKDTGVTFIDLHNISADALDALGQEAAKAYYNHDHTHTSLKGAQLNAEGIAKGLRASDCPLAKYLK